MSNYHSFLFFNVPPTLAPTVNLSRTANGGEYVEMQVPQPQRQRLLQSNNWSNFLWSSVLDLVASHS